MLRLGSSRPRRLRWLVPPAVAGAILGVVGLVPRLAAAEGQPNLPALSAQQLIEKVQASKVDSFSGNVRLTARLGLPSLGSLVPNVSDTASLVLSMLSGSHTTQVWVADPNHFRVALPSGLTEIDIIRNGSDLWQWQSDGLLVQHRTVPAVTPAETPAVVTPAETPAAAAQDLLNNIDPSTRVSVRNTAYVAGRPVYELVLAPRSGQSLVADVIIAVDAGTGLPLRVQVLGRNQTSPAVEVGFTSISFSRPAASTFAFKPPPGSRVNVPAGPEGKRRLSRTGPVTPPDPTAGALPAAPHGVTVVGKAWDSVMVFSGAALQGSQSRLLENATTPVAGPWGQGRLLTTSLVDALILPDGRILAGAVTPEALEAAVNAPANS